MAKQKEITIGSIKKKIKELGHDSLTAREARALNTFKKLQKTATKATERKGITPTDNLSEKGKQKRAYDLKAKRTMRAAGRDIFIPPVVNPERKESCRYDLKLFCTTYFMDRFDKPFCKDHDDLILAIQNAVLNGDLKGFALPRGSGKTTICEVGVIWAALYGHSKFLVILASNTAAAEEELLASIMITMDTTDELYEDFPHACAPIRALEGENKRCIGQTFQGQQTHIQWKKARVILPKIPDSECSETIIDATGILGRVRGKKHTTSIGKIVRPDFVMIDDPQTDESAASYSQCVKRLKVITGAVLGMAGPGKSISAVMPCTVIQRGDMADTALDRELHPEWQGTRVKMVEKWADVHDTEWLQTYAGLRQEGLRNSDGGEAGNKYYRDNQAMMDKGSVVYWAERFNEGKGEISAIQNAYNLLIDRGESIFQAEYQNDPLEEFAGQEKQLTEREIHARAIEPTKRREVPLGYETLTAFIDCGKGTLHYAIVAAGDFFSSCIIDYGKYEFSTGGKSGGIEGHLYTALENLCNLILPKNYPCANGTEHKILQIAIDAGWQTQTVYRFTRNSQFSNSMNPYMGQSHEGFRIPRKTPKARSGDAWFVQRTAKKEALLFHSNVDFWKSFVEERFRVPIGGRGALTIFKRHHPEFCGHMVAEKRTMKTAKTGEEYAKWEPKPGMANHWLDCVVGACAMAHYMGVRLSIEEQDEHKKGKEKKRVSFASMAKQGGV